MYRRFTHRFDYPSRELSSLCVERRYDKICNYFNRLVIDLFIVQLAQIMTSCWYIFKSFSAVI